MRVLVTGGAGFIGSHVVDALHARGDTPWVLDNFDPFYDPAIKRANLSASARLVEGDVRDAVLLDRTLPGCDAVVHLAARAGVRESMRDPAAYASVNVEGTATLLAAMARAGVRRMVLASSSSVYGARPGPFREDDPADRPESPYAASKRAAELFAAASGLDVACVRLFTVYGPRQRPGMAIARFVRAIRAGKPFPLYGDGSSTRDYTYVADAVDGILRGLDRAAGFRVVNLAGGTPVRLDTLVATIGTLVGRAPQPERLPAQPGDAPETRADLGVARAWLDWRPTTPLDEGLRRYVAWSARHPARAG